MQYKSRCHHHYLEGEENGVLIPEDGIDILEAGTVFLKWSACGHVDFPLDTKETIESFLKEKRNYPSSPAQLYSNSLDLI